MTKFLKSIFKNCSLLGEFYIKVSHINHRGESKTVLRLTWNLWMACRVDLHCHLFKFFFYFVPGWMNQQGLLACFGRQDGGFSEDSSVLCKKPYKQKKNFFGYDVNIYLWLSTRKCICSVENGYRQWDNYN